MIISQDKPFEEILELLQDHRAIFIIGCNTCASKLHVGGEEEILKMRSGLEDAGKDVIGWALPTAACSIRSWEHLAEKDRSIEKADAVLVMACGSGASVISRVTDMQVYTSNNTTSLGGIFKGEILPDQCKMCGSCIISNFGGICPTAQCPKNLLNGPCGGCANGKCETDPDKDCAWEVIYLKLKEMNRLDLVEKIYQPRENK